MDDSYFTIDHEALIEIKIKNSRFIGETLLALSTNEALEKLMQIRKREHAATHHCYAFRVGLFSEAVFKYSDDGEPSGTAGRPIFDQLSGAGITNVLLVVTRYFGGTKLGTGGLAHAYSEAAQLVVEKSGRRENFILTHFKVTLDFGHYDRLQKLLAKVGAVVISSDFSDVIVMELAIRRSRAEELKTGFIEITAGKANIETLHTIDP